MAVVERAGLEGLNFLGDTLMYCGAVLLLAGAMPREAQPREVADGSRQLPQPNQP
jgi:hypothetical protein